VTVLARFLVFNLLPSLAAGLLAWLLVWTAVRLLGIRSSSLSFCFYSLALFKSTLILLGIGLIFPWPVEWFGQLHRLAIPFNLAFPILLIWAAGAFLVYFLVVRKARQAALQGAQPADQAAPRLAAAFETVVEEFHQRPCPQFSDDLCCVIEQKQTRGCWFLST